MQRLALAALLGLLPVAAEAACETPYDFDTLLNDLGAAEAGLRGRDYASLLQTGEALREGLGCLDLVLPVVIAPRVQRVIGASLYIAGEVEDANRWLRAAAWLDPGFQYPAEELPAEHPVVRAWAAAVAERAEAPVQLEGLTLGEGRHFVDGAPVTLPEATPDAFHVYQRQIPGDDGGVWSWIILGTDFPPEASGPLQVAIAEPVEEIAPSLGPVAPERPYGLEPIEVRQRAWPAERVALIGAGGAAVVGSGVLYALSAGARNQFEAANNPHDLDRFRSRTNTLAVSSGLTFAAGAGALGFGALFFLIDGDPRPGLDLRFR